MQANDVYLIEPLFLHPTLEYVDLQAEGHERGSVLEVVKSLFPEKHSPTSLQIFCTIPEFQTQELHLRYVIYTYKIK